MGYGSYFNAGGAGVLTNVPGGTNKVYFYAGQWHQVMVVVDFEQTPTLAEFWVGKVGQMAQLYSWDWTQGGTITDHLVQMISLVQFSNLMKCTLIITIFQ